MIRINIHEAKTHLSRHLKAIERGETVILCRRNVPIAEIRPLPRRRRSERPVGKYPLPYQVPPEFFEPLPEGWLAGFEGRSATREDVPAGPEAGELVVEAAEPAAPYPRGPRGGEPGGAPAGEPEP